MAYDNPIAIITIAAEASDQPFEVQVAVASTMLNRLTKRRYGKTLAAVCLKRAQFSEWSDDKADNANLLRVVESADTAPMFSSAARALNYARTLPDTTKGATHFHEAAMATYPKWALGKTPCARIGAFLFYNDIDGPAPVVT